MPSRLCSAYVGIEWGHDSGGNITTAYEYGYAYDGGRRWRKDYAANIWTWYPCGAACSAGDQVEKQSDLTGSVWTTSAQYLKGLSIIRRNSEYHHTSLVSGAGIITNASGAILSNNLYDVFGALRFISGSAATPFRWNQAEEESLVRIGGSDYFPDRALPLQKTGPNPLPVPLPEEDCLQKCHKMYLKDLKACTKSYRSCRKFFWWIPYLCNALLTLCIGTAIADLEKCEANCLDEGE